MPLQFCALKIYRLPGFITVVLNHISYAPTPRVIELNLAWVRVERALLV